MRVLFLTLYPETAASSRYRVTQFLPYLRSQGIRSTVVSAVSAAMWQRYQGSNRPKRAAAYHIHETRRRIVHLLAARRYDVVFLQKGIMSAYLRGMPWLLDAIGDRLVFDIDDAVHLAPPHALGGVWSAFEDREQLKKVFPCAKKVLAGNHWLVDAVRTFGGRQVEHFPTVVDTVRFVPASKPPEDFTIGWIGSPSTTPMLETVAGTLSDQDVVLVGAERDRIRFDATVVPWSYPSEVESVQRFSVGILPQAKTEWERGKCALKALLYMACGVPCVATPWGAVCDMIEHGENGLLADSDEEWRVAFARLRDPAERKRMGDAARATVESHFALGTAAPRLAELLKEAA